MGRPRDRERFIEGYEREMPWDGDRGRDSRRDNYGGVPDWDRRLVDSSDRTRDKGYGGEFRNEDWRRRR